MPPFKFFPKMTTPLPTFTFSTTASEVASALSSHITNKTVLITGITKGGIGFETARVIALQKPKLVILAGRTPSKNENAKSLIQAEVPNLDIRVLELDLGSFEKVRESAEVLKGWEWEGSCIDVLINNAAVM